ncbi:uncharacterized protein LOC133977527 [Scomber scombrus]|uniref:uncharacterized protein LOC133977527 n=1 Tax=Scomber scombrus TaxID=13677 RepID=UPI002DDB1E97|nr:uncharacterized protein LOC133977527 [Scomber scombrus]
MKKMKRALLIVPIALVVLGLGFMYNGDTDMITSKRSSKTTTLKTPTVTPDSAEEQWTTGSPQSNLDGKMVTLSRNGGGIAFYPTYYINSSDSNSEYQTSPPPTRPYPYRLYPYGFYPTRPSYYSNYGNRFYPTQPYRNQFYFNKPYRNRFYPTQPYPYRFYPTQAYRNRFYPTQAYRNRFYPTQAYRNRFYPTQAYRNRFYQTEAYRNRFYPTQPYPDNFYPTQPYPDRFLPTTPYPRPYTTRPYRTTRYTTTPPTLYPNTTHYPRPYRTTRYPYWTTAPTTTGVSVCVRYLTDFEQAQYPTLFTLSPASRTALRLAVRPTGWYTLSWDRFSYYRLNLKSDNRFWSNIGPELWTRVCLTVDTIKNVAQVFSGSTMSIRKMLPIKYVWSGEPVIEMAGFDGQVTDVQMWDYPLPYSEIFNYMSGGVYGQYHGSVLTWSNIGYNLRGNTLLEKRYEFQEDEKSSEKSREKSSKKEKKHRSKGEKKTRKLLKEIRRDRKKLSQL